MFVPVRIIIAGLSKRLSTIVATKKKKDYKQRLIHSPPTASGVQTPSKLSLEKTQKPNVI